jgi:hypothetical protein
VSLEPWKLTGPTRLREDIDYEAYEELTAVIVKSSIFWDITPCSAMQVSNFMEHVYIASFCKVED